MMVKKIMIVTALAAFSALWAVSQSLPQFSSDDFDVLAWTAFPVR